MPEFYVMVDGLFIFQGILVLCCSILQAAIIWG